MIAQLEWRTVPERFSISRFAGHDPVAQRGQRAEATLLPHCQFDYKGLVSSLVSVAHLASFISNVSPHHPLHKHHLCRIPRPCLQTHQPLPPPHLRKRADGRQDLRSLSRCEDICASGRASSLRSACVRRDVSLQWFPGRLA